MYNKRELDDLFAELSGLSPLGYTVGLHIRFAAPLILRSTYPERWQKVYQVNAYALRDPLVFHAVGTAGRLRWSEIKLPDPFNVMGRAQAHGLTYGTVASCGKITSRSIGGAARDDREFKDHEMDAILDVLQRMHDIVEPKAELTDAMVEALRLIGQGYRHAEAAAELGISESALKARLSSARVRLRAQTTSEAVGKAREYGLL